MKPVLVVFAATCGVIAAESGHASACNGAKAQAVPPSQSTAPNAGTSGIPPSTSGSADAGKDASQTSWESPLARDVSNARRDNPYAAHTSAQTSYPGLAARVFTKATIFALTATGKVSGAGRDTTGDIGKPPIGIHNGLRRPAIQGRIK